METKLKNKIDPSQKGAVLPFNLQGSSIEKLES